MTVVTFSSLTRDRSSDVPGNLQSVNSLGEQDTHILPGAFKSMLSIILHHISKRSRPQEKAGPESDSRERPAADEQK